jgi:hypothetical protein
VQSLVNKSDLPVLSAALTNPRPHSIDFSLESSISTPSFVTARMNPLPLSLAGMANRIPFATLVLPGQKLKGESKIMVTKQTVHILDNPSFESFIQEALYSTNFTMVVTGKTKAFLGAIKAPIKLSKEIELPGIQSSCV